MRQGDVHRHLTVMSTLWMYVWTIVNMMELLRSDIDIYYISKFMWPTQPNAWELPRKISFQTAPRLETHEPRSRIDGTANKKRFQWLRLFQSANHRPENEAGGCASPPDRYVYSVNVCMWPTQPNAWVMPRKLSKPLHGEMKRDSQAMRGLHELLLLW